MPGTHFTRRFYERSPFPPPTHSSAKSWRPAPLEWILSIDRVRQPLPRRALVAGCGTGSEALLLQKALKDTEIVAVDFSPRSIRIARALQAESSVRRRVRFVQADLTQSALRREVGGDFDLVVCHGVLSYIPKPVSVLKNLAQCLRPDGQFYLGVNGADHFSASIRPVLAKVGIDLAQIPRDPSWRCLLQMQEAV